MSHIYADRVRETTVTTGTGTINLGGAVSQFQSFIAAVGNSNTCDYCITSGNLTDWEVGSGTVTSGSPNTLSRDVIYASSNSGLAISLSGTSGVFLTFAAIRAAHIFTSTKTTTYAIQAADSGTHFDDIGASSAVNFELPAAANNLIYTLSAFTAHAPYFTADGADVIYSGSDASTAGGTITAGAAYATLTLEAHGTNKWIVSSRVGEWTTA